MKRRFRRCAAAAGIAALLVLGDMAGLVVPDWSFVGEAQARLGRPITPGSVAGVARRTTRRVVRRSAIYVATLPTGCARMTISGIVVWSCGGTYYQSYNGRYVVVYID